MGSTDGRPHARVIGSTASRPPEWAILERRLIDELRRAAREFVARYAREDGTLAWRSEWAGMDGSDDPYEAFMYLALLYSVSGDEELYASARRMWDAITWQWTQYGQIDREFDAYYDWMHHGEGNLFHYFFGLTKPSSLVDRQRAERFARMYTGHDPVAPNFDRERGIIRASHTGSRGPRFVITPEDYSTHRMVFNGYPPPFEDLQTVAASGGTCDWTDDDTFAEILQKVNLRTSRGDVPLNLNATGQLTHAFLYSGDGAAREWVVDYLAGWSRRARANGGVIPDNVGLSGEVGEYLDGKWWGGHYGWRWPHGLLTVLEPAINAGMNALLLTGDESSLDLARDQLDRTHQLGRHEAGRWVVPHKHLDAGWSDYRAPDAVHAIQLWSRTFSDQDAQRVERSRQGESWGTYRSPTVPFSAKHFNVNTPAWYEFVRGGNTDYPVEALRANLALVARQLERLRSEEGDPANWPTMTHLDGNTDSPSLQTDGYAIHAWQEFCPVYFESLVHLVWGAPMHISHGGLQFATFRYYDLELRRPGLPESVAALVSAVGADSARLELVNLDPAEHRTLVVQAGAFRENRFTGVEVDGSPEQSQVLDSEWLEVELPPGSSVTLTLRFRRHAQSPSYETPWSARSDWPPTIRGRLEREPEPEPETA